MYNKVIASNNNNDCEVEEFIIKLNTENLSAFLSYRDEGNMNIVVSVNSQENEEKRVIRFKKILADDKAKCLDFADHKHELINFVNFEQLLQKYFDNADKFTVVPKIVFLDVDVTDLNNFLKHDRPVSRQKAVIGSNFGLLYRDVAFLPKEIYTGNQPVNGTFKDTSTFCIEIKAKQGYLINDEETLCVRKCRYCFYQYLKLKNEKINSVSSYCPIDLFSGTPERINRAIKGLMKNPQNNFKVFCDGKIVYNEYLKCQSSLHKILTNLFPNVERTERKEILFVSLIRKILLKDFSFCDKNVEVSSFDDDDENIHLRNCSMYEAWKSLPTNCILNSILKTQLLVSENFSEMEILDKSKEPINYDVNDQTILQNYKIGSTALDCSIMLTFRRTTPTITTSECVNDTNHYITLKGPRGFYENFIVNATIVDLDLKKDSIAHFRKYKKQYHESKLAYFDFMEKHSKQNN
ncbi:CLUMA_CG004856, isoform A [Clunio marinus]|uniref:Inositol-pentakisphosphate 2-kinase n=1 Tax=Clunio marinus TaxID=568069 RepID=A0A1J1HT47_9DIPT|nr:CLUMA_CG004856, isoform A [Clunio marinus]